MVRLALLTSVGAFALFGMWVGAVLALDWLDNRQFTRELRTLRVPYEAIE